MYGAIIVHPKAKAPYATPAAEIPMLLGNLSHILSTLHSFRILVYIIHCVFSLLTLRYETLIKLFLYCVHVSKKNYLAE